MYVNRRRFIGLGLAGCVGAGISEGISVESPYLRKKAGMLLPALAAYSFRNQFAMMKGKRNENVAEGDAMNMKGFIHYCASQKVAAELTSYFFDPAAPDTYFTECRMEAHLNGVPVAGTAVGNQFTLDPDSGKAREQMDYVKRWIDRAVLMGAPHVRVFAGRIPKGMEERQAERNAIAALQVAGDYAAGKGVFLGIENHDSIGSAEKLIKIVESVKNPWVGVNLDSGNFRTDNPYSDFEACLPYAVNIQIKKEINVDKQIVPIDMEKVFGMIDASGYRGYVVLEFEGGGDPFKEIPVLLSSMKEYIK